MRRLLWISGGFLLFLLAAMLLLPLFFRDKIDALLKAQINKNLNAQVDYKRLSLSFFRHFPALTLRLEGLVVANREPFLGDTLLRCEALDLGLDVLAALRGSLVITRLYLIEPRVYVHVLADGRANWDITLSDTTSTPEASAASQTSFRFSIARYAIQNASITYLDASSGISVWLVGLTHEGRGDFTQDLVALSTQTQIVQAFFEMGGVSYLSGQRLDSELELGLNLAENRYVIRSGYVALNDLKLALQGQVGLPDSLTTLLDLAFEAPGTSLKSLLSLIPVVYKKGYESLSTEGTLALKGYVRGAYRDSLLPAFGFRLSVERGVIRYKDLPQVLREVEVRLRVESPASTLESLRVDVDTLSVAAGQSHFRLSFHSQGLSAMHLKARLHAKGDLADFSAAIPSDYTLRGRYEADLSASGVYAESRLPAIWGRLALSEGYIKTAAYPAALEKLALNLTAESPNANPVQTTIDIDPLAFTLAGRPLALRLRLQDLEALRFDFGAKGQLDLGALLAIFPQDSLQLKGLLNFDLALKGSREALEKHDYARLPASGSLALENFFYHTPDLPKPVLISAAQFRFAPAYAELASLVGQAGQSDFSISGRLENYLGYLLKDEKIIGSLSLLSKKIDLNEWMSLDTSGSSSPSADTASQLSIMPIPANIDFVFQAQIGELLYDRMRFTSARGRLLIRDQKVLLEGFEMGAFGGQVRLAGFYRAPDRQNADWQMRFEMAQVRIEELAKNLATLRRIAPIVARTEGLTNLRLEASSRLRPDMMPDLATLSGSGLAEVLSAVVRGSASLQALSSATKLPALSEVTLKQTKIRFELREGGLYVEPFELQAGNLKMQVGGVTRLDQTIAYAIGIDVPNELVGSVRQSLGLGAAGPIRLLVDLGGTLKQPKVTSVRTDQGSASLTSSLQSKMEEEKKKLAEALRRKEDSLKAAAQAKADSLQRALQEKRRQEEERLRREAEERRKAEEERLRREAEEHRKAEEERLRRQIEEEKRKKEEELKKKLPFPR